MSFLCPYCRTPVEEGDTTLVQCESCATPHHGECWLENGGCTLFGCKLAPPDEPKVLVTNHETVLAANPFGATAYSVSPPTGFGDASVPRAMTAVAAPARTAPPPPPPPSSSASALTTVAPSEPARVVGYVAPGSIFAADVEQRAKAKSRIAFIMLGIFLGSIGAHNFYAGYVKRGILQLLLSVATLGYAAVVAWIWALVEICTVEHDARNISFI